MNEAMNEWKKTKKSFNIKRDLVFSSSLLALIHKTVVGPLI